jgi:hypothetical protein
MSHDFLQLCYVTNDFDQAIDKLRGVHSIGPFKEMRDHRVPTRGDKAAIGHFGLAFKADTQFEIIEPLAEDVGIYTDFLAGEGFQMRFHHIGRHISSLPDYRKALQEAKARWSVPIDMSAFGGHYAYADTRAEFGHYLELLCFPSDSLPTSVPRY